MKSLKEKYQHLIGKKVRIIHLSGEDNRYDGKEGIVERIDDMGDLHGTWGFLAIIPEEDAWRVIG